MILVQNPTDTKTKERLIVENAVAAFFAAGGKVAKPVRGARCKEHDLTKQTAARRASIRQRGEAKAKIEANRQSILAQHKDGRTIGNIATRLGLTPVLVKRAIFDAGECPGANSVQVLTRQQIIALKETAENGGTPSDAARWAGVSLSQARGAARDYGFRFGGQLP